MARIYGINDEPVPGYRLLKFLGRGGFGEVWKASAPGGTEAALKIITLGGKHALREFRALRLVKRIHHANLVPVNAIWLKDDRGNLINDTGGDIDSLFVRSSQEGELIIAMGLADKNLHDRLKECQAEGKPGIPPDELLDYMDSAAKALDFLNQPRHDLGTGPNATVPHCDVKPQNLLIVGDMVQVCDYGLVQVLGEDMRSISNVAGSYAYIAPELISETRPSKSTDQYSLAISYYELRSGALPFESFTLNDVMMAHTRSQLALIKVPEAEQAMLRWATAPHPEERYPSCTEMVKALRRAIEGESTKDQASAWRSRLTILLLLMVGGPLLGLGIVGLGRFLGIGSTGVASNLLAKELQEAIAAGRFREVADRLQEPATKSVLTAKEIEDLTELNTNGWLQLAAREFIDQRYDRAGQIVQAIRACYPGDAEARQLAERIQQKQTEQAQLRQKLSVPLQEFEQALERRRLPEARDALRRLQTHLARLDPEQRGLLVQGLHNQAKAVLTLIGDPQAGLEEVGQFVQELESLQYSEARLVVTLARAIVAARQRAYPAFFQALTSVAATREQQPDLWRAALAAAARASAGDPSIGGDTLKAFLGQLQPLVRQPRPAAAGELEEGYAQLVALLVRSGLAELRQAKDYQDLLAYVRQAQAVGMPDLLTRAALAECLLLQKDSELKGAVSRTDLEDARKALGPDEKGTSAASASSLEQTYVLYVRGLVQQADNRWLPAAQHYLQAFRTAQPWQTPGRRSLAAGACCLAADAFAENKERERAFGFYQAARRIQPALAPEYVLKLAEYAFQTKHFAVCEEATAVLLQEGVDKLGAQAYPTLLQNVRCHEALGQKAGALERYEEILDRRADKKALFEVLPLDFYKDVVARAVGLGEGLLQEGPPTATLKARLAKIYAAKGKLIQDHPNEEWPFGQDPQKEAAVTLAKAIQLYPRRDRILADYYAWHGFALMAVAPIDLSAVGRDWSNALALDGKHLSGLALKGHHLYLQAELAPRFTDEAVKKANESIQTYREAIRRAEALQESDAFLSYCHRTCSSAYVILANNRTAEQRPQIKADLHQAEESAEKAIALNARSLLAWRALGNAREDLAWSRLGKQPEKYPKALAAFQQEIELRPAKAEGYVNLARCTLKWIEDDVQQQQKVSDARQLLDKALKRDPAHAEGNYYLGKLLLLSGQKPAALPAFAKALAHPQDGHKWVLPVQYEIKADGADWQALFESVLPKNRSDYRVEHVPVLLRRYQILESLPGFRDADLRKDQPVLLADLDAIARLEKDPVQRARAYSLAINTRGAASKLLKDKNKQAQYRDEILRDMRQMLRLDPNMPSAHQWAKYLFTQLEADAEEQTLPAKRITLLEEAVEFADLAVKKAPVAEKAELQRLRSELAKKLRNLKGQRSP